MTSSKAPYCILCCLAPCNPEVKTILPNIGKELYVDNSRVSIYLNERCRRSTAKTAVRAFLRSGCSDGDDNSTKRKDSAVKQSALTAQSVLLVPPVPSVLSVLSVLPM